MVTWRFWPENTTAQNCHITLPLRSPPLQGSVWGLETLSATIGFLSLFWWAEDVNLRWASSLFEHRQIWSALSRGLCCRSHQTLINPWSMFSDDFRSLKVRLPWFHLLRHSMGQSLIRGISKKKKKKSFPFWVPHCNRLLTRSIMSAVSRCWNVTWWTMIAHEECCVTSLVRSNPVNFKSLGGGRINEAWWQSKSRHLGPMSG